MPRLIVTAPARADLRNIRSYTVEHHGHRGADAYDALLKQALRDIRDDPLRPGSRDRPEIGAGIRSYHTAHSRARAGTRIGSPRHFVLYFLPRENEVVISRILHDSRDLARHVPQDHIEVARDGGSVGRDPPRRRSR